MNPTPRSENSLAPEQQGILSSILRGCGILLGLLSRDLGRAIAVFGGLLTGFTALRWAIFERNFPGTNWLVFAVAGATFVLTGWVCSRD